MRRRAGRTALVDETVKDPLAAVDEALAFASRGERVTRTEARGLLDHLHDAIRCGTPDAETDQIIADAIASFSGQLVIDRSRLVDPLLDIRLALCGAAAS